jgi:hypothetical protein
MTLKITQSVSIKFAPYSTPVRELKEFFSHIPDEATIHTSFYDAGNDPRERDEVTMEASWQLDKERER